MDCTDWWRGLTALPLPLTAGLPEGKDSFVLLHIGLTLRLVKASACKQLGGSHTFDLLANALNDIHAEFEIRGKIVRTTTDNGSNFIKAFKVFGEDENSSAVEQEGQSEEEEDDVDEDEDVEFIDTVVLLNEDDGFEFQLPEYQRCACHILIG